MNKLAIIRLATYSVLIAIFLMAQQRITIIPAALNGAETRDEVAEAELRLKRRLERFEQIANSHGFFDAKRSGSELLSIASKAAADYGTKLGEFHQPEVKVMMTDGHLTWRLVFVRDYGPGVFVAPTEIFSIVIDDETGAATAKDETARM